MATVPYRTSSHSVYLPHINPCLYDQIPTEGVYRPYIQAMRALCIELTRL